MPFFALNSSNINMFEEIDAKVKVIDQNALIYDSVFNSIIIFLFIFVLVYSVSLIFKFRKFKPGYFDKDAIINFMKLVFPLKLSFFLIIFTGLVSFLVNFFLIFSKLKFSISTVFSLYSKNFLSVLQNAFLLSIIVIVIYLYFEKLIFKKILS